MGIIFLFIGIGLLLIGISFLFAWREDDWCGLDFNNGASFACHVFSAIIFSFALIMGVVSICIKSTKGEKVYERQQQRAYLVETYNMYKEDYEKDVVHYGTLKEISAEIADFNSTLYKEDFYIRKGWVGCFYVGSCGVEKIVIENGVAK